MEFDTKVRQVYRCDTEASSTKDLDGFCGGLWDNVFTKASKDVAEAGGGQFWLDYSTRLSARYLICDVTDISEDNVPEGGERQYRLKIYSAKKLGYVADVIFAVLAIGFMWCVSKVVAPEPPAVFVGGLVVIAALAGLLLAMVSKPFGPKEADALKDAVCRYVKS